MASTVAGACLLILPFCGGGGLCLVPALSAWLAYAGVEDLREGSRRGKLAALIKLATYFSVIIITIFIFNWLSEACLYPGAPGAPAGDAHGAGIPGCRARTGGPLDLALFGSRCPAVHAVGRGGTRRYGMAAARGAPSSTGSAAIPGRVRLACPGCGLGALGVRAVRRLRIAVRGAVGPCPVRGPSLPGRSTHRGASPGSSGR